MRRHRLNLLAVVALVIGAAAAGDAAPTPESARAARELVEVYLVDAFSREPLSSIRVTILGERTRMFGAPTEYALDQGRGALMLPQGARAIVLDAEGYTPVLIRAPGGRLAVDVRPRETMRGHFSWSTGEPLAEATLSVTTYLDPEGKLALETYEATLADDGSFELEAVAGLPAVLELRVEGVSVWSARRDSTEIRLPLSVVVERPDPVEVVVATAVGEPVADARVAASCGGREIGDTRTDDDGRAYLALNSRDLPCGIEARAASTAPSRRVITTLDETVELTLDPAGRLEGFVRGELRGVQALGVYAMTSSGIASETVGSDGSFRFDDIIGTSRVWAEGILPDGTRVRSRPIEVQLSPIEVRSVELWFENDVMVRGFVFIDGVPTHCLVSAERLDGTHPPITASSRSGPEFEMRLAPGTYTLTVVHPLLSEPNRTVHTLASDARLSIHLNGSRP